MVMTQAIVRALLTSGETDPVRFLTALNHALYGNVQRMGFATWRMVQKAGATASDSAASTTGTTNAVTIPALGCAVGVGGAQAQGSSGSARMSWSGLTEGYEHDPEAGNFGATGASLAPATSSTPTITITPNGSPAQQQMAVASWAPE